MESRHSPPFILDWKTKIIMIGDAGVGKTALMRGFVDKSFSPNYTATIGNLVTDGMLLFIT